MPYLDDDIVDVRVDGWEKPYQLYWGDKVELLGADARLQRIRFHRSGIPTEGAVKVDAIFRAEPILKFSMVDVQQGDGMVIETPAGKRVLVDGGDNVLFARHIAARFGGSTPDKPEIFDAIVVTHGDADHFDGLNQILKSENHREKSKRLYATTRRVLHNGLIKRPSSVAEPERLGPTVQDDGSVWCGDLHEDLLEVSPAIMNGPFRNWRKTLQVWNARLGQIEQGQAIRFERVDQNNTAAFDFLKEDGLEVEVLGPITRDIAGKPALKGLRAPRKDANIALGGAGGTGAMSPSHTINGHSISFRLRYGNVRFLMTGDLNQESMGLLRDALPDASLQAEIFKTPHHGSHDFDLAFVKEVAPVVSLISSGDESANKEHIHPRATLLGALGRASRSDVSVIFCTELAAFFKIKGHMLDPTTTNPTDRFYAFERSNFGIIHIRTDGERVLAFTHSGKAGLNEAYRFVVTADHEVKFAKAVSKVSAPPA